MSLEKNLKVCSLFDCYSNLLTQKQNLLVSEYYCLDRSLSEIAENEGISRQAVQETIAKAVKKLEGYEEKLHLCDLKQKTSLLQKQIPNNELVEQMLKLFNQE